MSEKCHATISFSLLATKKCNVFFANQKIAEQSID